MLKTKFLLIFLTLNGLLVGANSAFASVGDATIQERDISRLSHTISNLIDLDGDAHSLIELAINRALIAKGVKENTPPPTTHPIVNGKVAAPSPIINGKVAAPPRPMIGGGIAKPAPKPVADKPLINGTMPQPTPAPKPVADKPLINGLILNPNK